MRGLSLDARDVSAVRELLDLLHRDDGAVLPWPFLRRLKEVIDCDDLSFNGLDSGAERHYLAQWVEGDEETELVGVDPSWEDPAFWAHFWQSKPCSYPDTSGDCTSVTRISDFYSASQWRGSAMYRDCFGAGAEHEMMACLPDGTGRTLRLLCFRGPGPDFGDREVFLLQVLRPHIAEACRAAARRYSGTGSLTSRQVEILHLVRAGHSNRQIARRTGISEGTVRTHLNGIFIRLGVDSRTAAANRLPEPTLGDALMGARCG